jgi:hypothetical protein
MHAASGFLQAERLLGTCSSQVGVLHLFPAQYSALKMIANLLLKSACLYHLYSNSH